MKTLKLLIILSLLGFTAKAQVGVNTLDPDTTAILHIYSNNKGVLLPILDSSARAPLGSDGSYVAPGADGLLVYDSVGKVYYFLNRSTGKWLALNPFQTTDEEDISGHGNDDIRLATRFQGRNVVIGDSNADVGMKLHVKGNIKSDNTLYAENARISDSTWSKKMGSDSIKAKFTDITTAHITTANFNNIKATSNIDTIVALTIHSNSIIPIGGIIMWSGHKDSVPSCWRIFDEMADKFPVGVHTTDASTIYNVRQSIDKNWRSGQNEVALNINQMPRHQHRFRDVRKNNEVSGSSWAHVPGSYNEIRDGLNEEKYTDFRGNSALGDNEGNGQAHENRPPFYGVYFIIKTSNSRP
jgi:hypothetical protein